MRALFWIAVATAAAAGCKADDGTWHVFPPGGGGGGGGGDDTTGADGGAPDGGGSTGLLDGHVCVITAFDLAPDCGIAEGHDVLVEVPGGNSDVSDATGAFSIDIGASTTVELRVGSEDTDALVTTDSIAHATGADVSAPGVDQDLWDSTLIQLGETADAGALLVYVVDTTGAPVEGATVGFVTPPSGTPRIYYDTGDGGWDGNAVVTGPDGIALILDAATSDVQATLSTRNADETVPSGAFSIGVGTITLPD